LSFISHLNGIKAFDAAARHLSFTHAGAELGVTPAAVGQQVRLLEQYLGVQLFERQKKRLVLSERGRAVLPEIRDGLDKLASAMNKLKKDRKRQTLVVSTAPSFAAKWLMPRIEQFSKHHIDINIKLDVTERLVDLNREPISIAIRYGEGSYAGLRSQLLLSEAIFPVCSPKLLAVLGGMLQPETIKKATLLHDETLSFEAGYPTWATWCAKHGLRDLDTSRGLRFNSSVLATQAAIEGLGFSLGRSVIVEDDIAAGRLVIPFTHSVPSPYAYYIVRPIQSHDTRLADEFADFLVGCTITS
jgi:LysR family transcriptional regulator, glycine cleavage system transcriptional activator